MRTTVVQQPQPTGMLDAILIGIAALTDARPERVWVTWCDQVAVHPDTARRLAATEDDSDMTLPVVTRDTPYIHFDRDVQQRIVGVRQRREGDVMPESGESDMGLFSLSAGVAFEGISAICRHRDTRRVPRASAISCRSFRGWRSGATCGRSQRHTPWKPWGSTRPKNLAAVSAWLRKS